MPWSRKLVTPHHTQGRPQNRNPPWGTLSHVGVVGSAATLLLPLRRGLGRLELVPPLKAGRIGGARLLAL
jgi:hypothetical protein